MAIATLMASEGRTQIAADRAKGITLWIATAVLDGRRIYAVTRDPETFLKTAIEHAPPEVLAAIRRAGPTFPVSVFPVLPEDYVKNPQLHAAIAHCGLDCWRDAPKETPPPGEAVKPIGPLRPGRVPRETRGPRRPGRARGR